LLKAIALQEKLVKEPGHHAQDVLDHAMSYNNLGILYQSLDRHDEAGKAWRKALAIREELLAEKPGLVQVWDGMTMSYVNLASHCRRKKDAAGAIENLQKAVAAGEKAVEMQPGVEEPVGRLARVLNLLGERLAEQGRFAPALERHERALKVLDPWQKKGAENLTPQLGRALLDAHADAAAALNELKRYKEALRHHDLALRLAPADERNALLYKRALTSVRAGQHRAAVDDVLDLLPRSSTANQKFPLAALYGRAVRAAARDQQLSAEQRKDVADLYARRAVELLRQCHDEGLFAQEAYRKALRGSEALSALAERDDYKKLLAKVEKKDESDD
jgi:tetratricopeptide (TPR) repeat protein